jgi:type II secretory pathway pseudopilin PulG
MFKKEGLSMLPIKRQQGFAVLEMILIVTIIAIVAVVGGWVYKQRTKTVNSSSTPAYSKAAIKTGTVDGVDQLTQQDAASETTIDSNHQGSEQASAQSTNSAQKDIGGAYNESSY